jgi:hypothetical protein
MGVGAMLLGIGTAGVGFVIADGLDRLLATYNPSDAKKPTDRFTSDGTGMLANTLNVAAMPNWKRVVAGVGLTAAPAVGSMFVKNTYVRGALEGLALGAGISVFKLVWSNVLMPMLIGKDTSAPALQKSYIARLYPTEVASSLNKKQAMSNVSSSGSGALSGAPEQQTGVGSPDVGPFALAGDSPYPDASQALRSGVSDDPGYPSTSQALRAGVSGDSPYPSAGQALHAGVSAPAPTPTGGSDPNWNPGPPPGSGPGPQAKPHSSCGCVGENNAFLGFIGEAVEETPFLGAVA